MPLMHKIINANRKGQSSQKITISLNLTHHTYIRLIISKVNIIVTKHLNQPMNTCAMPRIDLHNPIQG